MRLLLLKVIFLCASVGQVLGSSPWTLIYDEHKNINFIGQMQDFIDKSVSIYSPNQIFRKVNADAF